MICKACILKQDFPIFGNMMPRRTCMQNDYVQLCSSLKLSSHELYNVSERPRRLASTSPRCRRKGDPRSNVTKQRPWVFESNFCEHKRNFSGFSLWNAAPALTSVSLSLSSLKASNLNAKAKSRHFGQQKHSQELTFSFKRPTRKNQSNNHSTHINKSNDITNRNNPWKSDSIQ